jgi:F-type H+-transporting ATPase subunit b
MKGRFLRRLIRLSLLACLVLAPVFAQETKPAQQSAASQPEPAPQDPAPAAAPQQPANPNAAIGEDLSAASHAAEKSEEAAEENARFKYSAPVRWIAKRLNGDPHVAYLVSLVINFGLMVAFFYVLLKSRLPQAFRDRTAAIQKGIRDAEAASAEAARRLSKVEARLSKLDAEVAEIRSEAERNATDEEDRIHKAAEEDKQKVVEAAEAEISAIARNARRDLKSYAASLAVDLAARKIHVDENTDQALVHDFVDRLGRDGK